MEVEEVVGHSHNSARSDDVVIEPCESGGQKNIEPEISGTVTEIEPNVYVMS